MKFFGGISIIKFNTLDTPVKNGVARRRYTICITGETEIIACVQYGGIIKPTAISCARQMYGQSVP